MTWSLEQLAGKSADVFNPPQRARPRGVVLFLHGYDGVTLRDNETYTHLFAQHGLSCVCPHGPQCWWTDRGYAAFDQAVSPLDFLHQSIPDFCQQLWGIEPPQIAVCGIEMGGQGALQLAYRCARQFPLVVAISPKVDFETWYGHGTSLDEIFPTREAARQATAILHIHPLNWPKHQLLLCDSQDFYCCDGVQTLMSKLSSTGIPFEADVETTHGGYGWEYANFMAPRVMEFIATRLD